MIRVLCLSGCLAALLAAGCASNGAQVKADLERERAMVASLSEQLRITDGENQKLKATAKSADAVLADLKAKHAAELDLLQKKSGVLSGLATVEGVSVDAKGMVEVKGLSFELGGAELTPDAVKTLAKVAEALVSHKGLICVDGHTDNVPVERAETKKTFVDNLGLSLARAAAVARVLIDNKVPQDKLIVRGFGESRPIASNDTDEGRQKNRRVEIRLVTAPPDAKDK